MKKIEFYMGLLTAALIMWLVYLSDISAIPGASGNKYMPEEQVLRVDQ